MAVISVTLKHSFEDWRVKTNEIGTAVGDMLALTTSDKVSLVRAINEHETQIGDMAFTGVMSATDITEAISEHETDIGSMSLSTTATNLTSAINEHESDIGSMILTTDAATLTGAVNELDGSVDNNDSDIEDLFIDVGDLILSTTATDLTAAINEHEGDIGDMVLDTAATNISDAIDELHTEIGQNTSDRHNHSNKAILDATTASFLVADESKLDGIELLADVTDATNVNSAGAVMNTDYNAGTMMIATSDNTPSPSNVATVKSWLSLTAADVSDFDTEVGNHTDVDANTTARHTHSNAGVLDATTASFLLADETKLDFITATSAIDLDWFTIPQAIDLTQLTALTATDATVIDATYDATEQGVLNNVRTRIDELETRLKSVGILPT